MILYMGEGLRFGVDCDICTGTRKALMPHRNAPLTELGCLRLARCVVEDGWALRRAAERFQVAVTTARRWADRYRQQGAAGMADRSSRPHHSPNRTPTRTERRIIKVRLLRRWGPARIAYLLGLHPSTVHRVLTRYRLCRLTCQDRATGRPIRRYEHPAPGDLVHVDIKKLGNIPDGGGHQAHGRQAGGRNSSAHRDPDRPRTHHGRPNLGYSYLHNAIDDHSRLAYTEILPDETKQSATTFWQRAQAFFTHAGITVRRVLTTTAAATALISGATPCTQPASPTNAPAPTGPRPTVKPNATTAPCSTNGPTPSPTPQKPNAAPPCRPGCTPTITTADTPH